MLPPSTKFINILYLENIYFFSDFCTKTQDKKKKNRMRKREKEYNFSTCLFQIEMLSFIRTSKIKTLNKDLFNKLKS